MRGHTQKNFQSDASELTITTDLQRGTRLSLMQAQCEQFSHQ